VRLEKFNDLYRVMPFIHRTSAKFNIPLNMTLLEEGDDLLDAKRPDHALLLYRLVIPYSELKRQIVNRVGSVQRDVTQLEDKKSGLADDTRRMRELTRTLEALKEEEEELDGVPDYDEELKIRLGDVYYALNRFEEAIQLYLSIQKAKPDHELAQRAMYSAYITAYSGQENERALEIARAYMDRYPNGEFWDDVTLHAVALLSDMERWFEAVDVSDRALAGNPEHAAIDNILYMKAYAQFMMSLIRESMATFEKLINEHGRSSFRPNAEYWHALGHLFLQQYMEAKQEFTAFTTQYKRGPLREDAYFRRGVAEYGLGDFESAKSTFESFVGEYPTSILTSEALAMVGDILASWGQLDEAMDHYRRAVDKAINMVQADYATFQQARTYELEQKWQEIIDLFTAYNARFPDDANYTEATYWMGNAYKQLNRPDKALELFYDSIVTYGNDLKAYGIDFILRDLAEEVRQVRAQNAISKLALDMRERLNDELDKALADNKQTLLLRLEGLMYETSDNGELRAAIRQRMLQERNIPLAAPISLVTMGKMAREAGDAALTGKIYEHFLDKYEDSDLILDALEGLSVARIEEKRYVEALDLLKSITDRYPTLPQAAEAYLRMGDIHRMDGQPDKAIDTYTLILTVKDWRGELWPRALLKVGDTHAEINKHAEAFGFYQRVYVMYVGYPEQAAEAYTKSARMLEAMGKIHEARATLKEMLDQAALARQPIAQEARSLLLRLP
jgi:TolA-binding protein